MLWDANKTIGIRWNKPLPTWLLCFWGTYSLAWDELRPPTQWLNSLDMFGPCTAILFRGLLDYKVIPTCVDNVLPFHFFLSLPMADLNSIFLKISQFRFYIIHTIKVPTNCHPVRQSLKETKWNKAPTSHHGYAPDGMRIWCKVCPLGPEMPSFPQGPTKLGAIPNQGGSSYLTTG